MVRGLNETLSVYVIDDDDAVRDSLEALLEPEGFVVKPYSSADEFLNDLEVNHPGDGGRRCLLLDLHMPGKGGQDLLNILVARDIRLSVVVMTGNADDKSRSLALRSGAAAFLEKPVDADVLIDAIRTALR